MGNPYSCYDSCECDKLMERIKLFKPIPNGKKVLHLIYK